MRQTDRQTDRGTETDRRKEISVSRQKLRTQKGDQTPGLRLLPRHSRDADRKGLGDRLGIRDPRKLSPTRALVGARGYRPELSS